MSKWLAFTQDAGDHVDVVPLLDSLVHEAGDSCVCGPTMEPVHRADGSVGWLCTHHALDGREQHEHA